MAQFVSVNFVYIRTCASQQCEHQTCIHPYMYTRSFSLELLQLTFFLNKTAGALLCHLRGEKHVGFLQSRYYIKGASRTQGIKTPHANHYVNYGMHLIRDC